jgi:hypothetical protein
MTMASFSFQLSKNNQRFPRFVVYTPLSLRIAVGGGLMRHGSPTLNAASLSATTSRYVARCRSIAWCILWQTIQSKTERKSFAYQFDFTRKYSIMDVTQFCQT